MVAPGGRDLRSCPRPFPSPAGGLLAPGKAEGVLFRNVAEALPWRVMATSSPNTPLRQALVQLKRPTQGDLELVFYNLLASESALTKVRVGTPLEGEALVSLAWMAGEG